MVFPNKYHCEKCGKQYTDLEYKWCKPCLVNDLKNTSGNEKIDILIQEMQLKVDSYLDIIFEWIPYDQFNNIEKIGKGGFSTVYSAIWKDGPLYFNRLNNKYVRRQDNKVALKCLYNSQNITNEFLNEV